MKKQFVDKDCWSEALHTALRKCCDSLPSSIAWNAIYLMDKNVWPEYVDHVCKVVSESGITPDDVKGLVKQIKNASLEYNLYGKGHAAVIFHCAMKEFSDYDWQGYAEFLTWEPKPKKTKKGA
jgi:hypothetical protein